MLASVFFHQESVTFVISRNTDIDYILYLILILTFESLKVVLIIMVAILMISTELATLSLLKIKVFCKRGYNFIISVHDVTNKILSSDSNYLVDVVI